MKKFRGEITQMALAGLVWVLKGDQEQYELVVEKELELREGEAVVSGTIDSQGMSIAMVGPLLVVDSIEYIDPA